MVKSALVIGGGHNGLVCAFYLARAGVHVTICERRGVVGGAAVTEEFHPGFRNSVASYTVSLLHERVIADMGLAALGLRIVERPIANFLPTADGLYLKFGGGMARCQAEIAKFSQRDAAILPQYQAMIDAVGDVVRDLAVLTPPSQPDGLAGLGRLLGQSNRLRKLALPVQRDLLDLFTKSARDVLDSWFESEPIKAVLGFDAVVGNYASPETPGSAYVLLHHTIGAVNGKRGAWGHAIGGMGAITQAMALACGRVGVQVRLAQPVAQVIVARNRARGVVLEDGTRLLADCVVANVNPKLLFERLMPQDVLDADFQGRIERYKCGSGTFRMIVALSELPDFTCLPGRTVAEHHRSGIILAPSLAYMDRAYTEAKQNGWSSAPIVEMVIPSTLDESLAPPGRHVASLFCQHVAPDLPVAYRAEVAAHMIDTVTAYAPNFRDAVIGQMALLPRDLEATFGLVGGDIFHGAMTLDQLYAARPVLGQASYKAPIGALFLCGAGTHPGGGVSGLPGYNAAREILRG